MDVVLLQPIEALSSWLLLLLSFTCSPVSSPVGLNAILHISPSLVSIGEVLDGLGGAPF